MLKIKDNIDLKELEKFGFREEIVVYNRSKIYTFRRKDKEKTDISYIEVSYDIGGFYKLCVNLENFYCWCNTLEDLDNDYQSITKSYNIFKDKINELIEAGLIEKVEDD